jgi:hypothetical protein
LSATGEKLHSPVSLAAPLRSQARASWKALAIVAALLVLSGCGDDEDQRSAPTQPTTVTTGDENGLDARKEPATVDRAAPTRRERPLQRDLARHLEQEARTRSRGEWTAADIEAVSVRGTEVVVATRLRGARGREQAASICVSAREFFLSGGRTQTPYDVVVTDGDTALAAC